MADRAEIERRALSTEGLRIANEAHARTDVGDNKMLAALRANLAFALTQPAVSEVPGDRKRVETVECGCPLPAMVTDEGTCTGCGAQVIREVPGNSGGGRLVEAATGLRELVEPQAAGPISSLDRDLGGRILAALVQLDTCVAAVSGGNSGGVEEAVHTLASTIGRARLNLREPVEAEQAAAELRDAADAMGRLRGALTQPVSVQPQLSDEDGERLEEIAQGLEGSAAQAANAGDDNGSADRQRAADLLRKLAQRSCPDGASCFHLCSESQCWRVHHCPPLSDHGEPWSDEELERYENPDVRRIRDCVGRLARREVQWADLPDLLGVERVEYRGRVEFHVRTAARTGRETPIFECGDLRLYALVQQHGEVEEDAE